MESAGSSSAGWGARTAGLLGAFLCCLAWPYVTTGLYARFAYGPNPDLEAGGRFFVASLWFVFTFFAVFGGMVGYLLMRGNGRSIPRAIALLNIGLVLPLLAIGALAVLGAVDL